MTDQNNRRPLPERLLNARSTMRLSRKKTVGERSNYLEQYSSYDSKEPDSSQQSTEEKLPVTTTREGDVLATRQSDDRNEYIKENVPAAKAIMEEANVPQPIDAKKHVHAVEELAKEVESAEEISSRAATLEALSLLPELEVEAVDETERSTQEDVKADDEEEEEQRRQRPVDFLLLGVHGIGADTATLAQNKKDLKEHMKFIKAHWFWELEFKTHLELVDWKSDLLPRQIEAFRKILPHVDHYKKILSSENSAISTLSKKPKASAWSDPRLLVTDHLSDILCFMTPIHGDFIVQSVADHLNKTVEILQGRAHGRFKNSKIILIGHSLGGIILYELLTGIRLRPGQPLSNPPKLSFHAESFFMWGVPLSAFCTLSNQDFSLCAPVLPTGVRLFNIFHPFDPIAFRFEPLFYPGLDPVPPPVRLPHWRTNGAKEYFHWERDLTNAKKAFTIFWTSTEQKFRTILGGITSEKKPDKVTGSDVTVNEMAPLAEQTPSERSVLNWASERRVACQKVDAENRYGAHDKKAIVRRFGFEIGRRSGSAIKERGDSDGLEVGGDQPWLGGKRKAATVVQLMKMLNIPESERKRLVGKLTTGREEKQFTDVSVLERRISSLKSLDDLDLLSEVEEGGGLELPVRLDFALQEELTERYISQLGTLQSHFNYWLSRDAVFFMLKELTRFHPRISYPDFLQVLKFSEEYQTKTTEGTTLSVTAQSDPPKLLEKEESHSSSPPKQLRTLKRAPVDQIYSDENEGVAVGEGAEQGKVFFA